MRFADKAHLYDYPTTPTRFSLLGPRLADKDFTVNDLAEVIEKFIKVEHPNNKITSWNRFPIDGEKLLPVPPPFTTVIDRSPVKKENTVSRFYYAHSDTTKGDTQSENAIHVRAITYNGRHFNILKVTVDSPIGECYELAKTMSELVGAFHEHRFAPLIIDLADKLAALPDALKGTPLQIWRNFEEKKVEVFAGDHCIGEHSFPDQVTFELKRSLNDYAKEWGRLAELSGLAYTIDTRTALVTQAEKEETPFQFQEEEQEDTRLAMA